MVIHAMNLDPALPAEKKKYFAPEDLVEGMNALSGFRDSSTDALDLLLRIYYDLEPFFGYELGTEHHSAVAAGYCTAGRMKDALALLDEMDPDDVDWTQLLRLTVEGQLGHVDAIVSRIRDTRPLNSEDYELLLLDSRKQVERPQRDPERAERQLAKLDEIRRSMAEDGVTATPSGQVSIAKVLFAGGMGDEARETLARWSAEPPERLLGEQWELMSEYALSGGESWDLARRMVNGGHPASSRLLVHLLSQQLSPDSGPTTGSDASRVIAAIAFVEKDLGVVCSADVWREAIDRWIFDQRGTTNGSLLSLPPPHPDAQSEKYSMDRRTQAMEMYRTARSRGIQVDTKLASLFVYNLCSHTPVALNQALEVYDNWLAGPEPEAKDEEEITNVRGVFQTLLYAITSAGLDNNLATAQDMVREIVEQEIRFPPEIIDDLVPLLMSKSPTYRIAYGFYSDLLKSSPLSFTLTTFTRAIEQMRNLRPPSKSDAPPCPPSSFLIQIMTDMQLAGTVPPQKFYRDLVYHYGQLGLAGRKSIQGGAAGNTVLSNHLAEIKTHIDRLYTRYKLDPNIDLSCDMLNVLMDAYNLVGARESGLAIWDELAESRTRLPPATAKRIYPVSVAIVLDLLGHQGSRSASDEVWNWARKFGYATEVRLWNGRVENLCRTHQFEEAQNVVFDEMRLNLDHAPSPDFATIEILVKFTSTWDAYRDSTMTRARSYFPQWWDRIRLIYEARRGGSKWEKTQAAYRSYGGAQGVEQG